MLNGIIMGWSQRMQSGEDMWIVELNIAGYRVAREVPELTAASRRALRFRPRDIRWRAPGSSDSHAG